MTVRSNWTAGTRRTDRWVLAFLPFLPFGLAGCGDSTAPIADDTTVVASPGRMVALPSPETAGGMALSSALASRRTSRSIASSPITVSQLSQVLWAAQGVTDAEGRRTAPSAGQSYPLGLLVAVGNVDGLVPGLYRYLAERHALDAVREGDLRGAVIEAVGQEWLGSAPALLVVCAEFDETRRMYGEKGVAHVHVEAGAAVQNVYLQTTAMGLATGFVGGFDEDQIRRALHLETGTSPIGVMPIGYGFE